MNHANAQKTIAFIPLRTSDDDNALIDDGDYFIEAVNDKLNSVSSITVVPRISTLQYRGTNEDPDIIRKNLKADYLLDGSIRRENHTTNIWIELSSARANKVLWSKSYVWDKTQISQLSREIVRNVIENLGIKLTPENIKLIETEPSKNPDANFSFISANVISNDAWFYFNYGNKLIDSVSFNSAVKTYDKAIEYDSLFALAYARRAIATAWGYYVSQFDSTYIEKCKEDIDKALALNSNLSDAKIALGFYYYYCVNDFENALLSFKTAAEMDPGNYQPLFYMAIVYRKMGEWDKSQKLISKVIPFNPKEALFLTNIGLSYAYLHNFDSAIIFHQKAIDIMPEWSPPYKNKILAQLLKYGNTDEARRTLDRGIIETGEGMQEYKIQLDIIDGNYLEALQEVESADPSDFNNIAGKYIYMALINNNLNNPEVARIYYDSAKVILNSAIKNGLLSSNLYSALGLTLAGLDYKEEAISAGKMAVEAAKKNTMDESDMKLILAQIYTITGEYDTAIKSIEYLLNNPSCLSDKLLRLDPVWQSLYNQTKFKSLLNK